MIQLLIREESSFRSCATCRYYRTKEHDPSELVFEPYCGLDESLMLPPKRLTRSFCARWEVLDKESMTVYYEELMRMTA